MLQMSDFRDNTSKFYLSQELKLISEDEFEEQLNILPPLMWKTSGDSFPTFPRVEHFMSSEMAYGSITRQYYKCQSGCFMKYVDCRDQSTWISQTLIYNFKQFITRCIDSYIFAMKVIVRELIAEELINTHIVNEGLEIEREIHDCR